MDISVAKEIGDERDNRQRTPEKRIILDSLAAKQIGAKFVWSATPDDASAQHWAKDTCRDVSHLSCLGASRATDPTRHRNS